MKLLSIALRLAAIVAGFAAACLAAALAIFASNAVLVVTGYERRAFDVHAAPFDPGAVFDVAGIIATYALLPAVIFIALTEKERWRRWPAFVLFGALLPLPVSLLVAINSRMPEHMLFFAAQLPVAGALGGLAYWAVAGRRGRTA